VRALGLTAAQVRVRVSDRRLLNAVLGAFALTEPQVTAVYAWLDKQGRGDAQPSQRLRDLKVDPDILDFLGAAAQVKDLARLKRVLSQKRQAMAALASLEQVVEALHFMGVGDFVDIDLGVVRGLAYYTGTVFELFDTGRTLRAICGGGRYDNLLSALGGVDLPSVGFGMGDVVLSELLRDRGLVPTDISSIDVFLAFITKDDLPHVLSLARRLRDAGLRTEYALSPQTVGKQLNLGNARNARLAVVIGPDERARGELVVKDLGSGTQETVAEGAVVELLKARTHG
jgi:histidyl-tRNA synthetase